MEKIVFVGICNKEGYMPLDSRSRSGAVIERVIKGISIPCEKTNLFHGYFVPQVDFRKAAIKRFKIEENAFYIGLGKIVEESLQHIGPNKFKAFRHPGWVLRNGMVEPYVKHMIVEINGILNHHGIHANGF